MFGTGDIIELEITDFGGVDGVGRCSGIVVFVENAVPGDIVRARVRSVKKGFARAETVEILKYSPEREEPVCDAFGLCGGCAFLHVNYETELKYKKKKVNDALKRIGGLDFEVDEIIGMKQPYHYRNKAVYHVSDDGGELQIGFYGAKSNKIAPVSGCMMFGEENLRIIEAFRRYAAECGKVSVKSLMVRGSRGNSEILVNADTEGKKLTNPAGLVYHLTQCSPKVKGIILNAEHVIWGDSHITEEISGFTFKISAVSFFQVNPEMTRVLYEKASGLAALSKTDTVIDAYAGAGTVSVFISPFAGNVIGIELDRQSVLDAEENAELNRARNVRFIQGDANELLGELYDEGIRPDTVILDPPRKGCGSGAIAALGRLAPGKIVYISCDPATLARDLKELSSFGYAPEKGVCIDMFARSAHVETVILAVKKSLCDA